MIAIENFASYRTLFAFHLAVFYLLLDQAFFFLKKPVTKKIFSYVILLFLIVTGFYNYNFQFVNPVKTEHKAFMAEMKSNVNVLVTAGSTVEYIDSVRILTNLSSGKMGLNIAQQCLDKGFNVTLVYGHGTLNIPDDPRMNIIRVRTTEEMFKAVRERTLRGKQHVVFHAAAVADFTISHSSKNRSYKMDTRNGTKTLKLVPTAKIVDRIKEFDKKLFLVAFKTEYDILEELLIKKAFDKLRECNGDLIVANDVSRRGCDFGSDTNEVYIIDKEKNITHVPLKSKREIARNLVKIVCNKLNID